MRPMRYSTHGYFDESGTHGSSRVTTLAGYIGTAIQWRSCLSKWQEALATDGERMKEFHAAEFDSYAKSRRWSDQKREDFLSNLGTIINDHTWFGISGSVVSSAYDNLPLWLHQRIGSSYRFCFYVVMDLLRKHWRNVWSQTPMALIFENRDDVRKKMKKVFQKDAGDDFHCKFGTTANYPLLQVADFLVYEMNRGIDNALHVKKPVRKALDKIREGRKIIYGYHDAETLAELPAWLEQDYKKLRGKDGVWWPCSWHKNYDSSKRNTLERVMHFVSSASQLV